MAVTGEVEEDRPLLTRLVGLTCSLERAVDGVRGLGCGDDPSVFAKRMAEANTSLWR
jgi:hypothetical protein